MILTHSCRAALAIAALFTACFGQPNNLIEPCFSLSLSGNCGKGTAYHYQLNRAGDSGTVIVQGSERPVSRVHFYNVKRLIVDCAMNLTEASYGSPRDSADFSGDLNISALDQTTIIKLTARVVIGTQSDSSMAVLLRLLMDQVDDTLRLPQFKHIVPTERPAGTRKGQKMKNSKDQSNHVSQSITLHKVIEQLSDSLKQNLLPEKCEVIGTLEDNRVVRLCYGNSRPPGRRWFVVTREGVLLREIDLKEASKYGEVPWR